MPKTRKSHNSARIAPWAAIGLLLLASSALLAQKKKIPQPSGFLSDYSKLAEDPEQKGSRLIYKNPDFEKSDFDALYLEEPVLMVYSQDEPETIDADKAAKMLRLVVRFDDVLREELEEHGVDLVYEAGPGVLHCRWAITNLKKSRFIQRVMPLPRLLGQGRGGAAMECECTDSESGKVVVQVVKADKGTMRSGVTTWAGAESAIRRFARDLAARLAEKGV